MRDLLFLMQQVISPGNFSLTKSEVLKKRPCRNDRVKAIFPKSSSKDRRTGTPHTRPALLYNQCFFSIGFFCLRNQAPSQFMFWEKEKRLFPVWDFTAWKQVSQV